MAHVRTLWQIVEANGLPEGAHILLATNSGSLTSSRNAHIRNTHALEHDETRK